MGFPLAVRGVEVVPPGLSRGCRIVEPASMTCMAAMNSFWMYQLHACADLGLFQLTEALVMTLDDKSPSSFLLLLDIVLSHFSSSLNFLFFVHSFNVSADDADGIYKKRMTTFSIQRNLRKGAALKVGRWT